MNHSTAFPGVPREARFAADPRDEPPGQPGQCCNVRQTLQIGPGEAVPDADPRWGVTWQSYTPLTMRGPAACQDGLLSLNFVSFCTSSGDFSTVTRSIELFLVRSTPTISNRLDVWSIPIFKGTVALHTEQFEGGMPVPMDPAGNGRMGLRVLVEAGATSPWSVMCGLMLNAQNSF